MKKKKLSLEDIMVESFITSSNDFLDHTPQIKGGTNAPYMMNMSPMVFSCENIKQCEEAAKIVAAEVAEAIEYWLFISGRATPALAGTPIKIQMQSRIPGQEYCGGGA